MASPTVLAVLLCGLGCSVMGSSLDLVAKRLRRLPGVEVIERTHDQWQQALPQIRRRSSSGAGIVLIGHSRGGEAAIELAQRWRSESVLPIDLLVLYEACGVFGVPPVPGNVLVAVSYRPMLSGCTVRNILMGDARPAEGNALTIFIAPPRLAADHVSIARLSGPLEEIEFDVLRIIRDRRAKSAP